MFMEIKPHAAHGLKTRSGANVIYVNSLLLTLKTFATWIPMIYLKVNLKVFFFNIDMKLFFEVIFSLLLLMKLFNLFRCFYVAQ